MHTPVCVWKRERIAGNRGCGQDGPTELTCQDLTRDAKQSSKSKPVQAAEPATNLHCCLSSTNTHIHIHTNAHTHTHTHTYVPSTHLLLLSCPPRSLQVSIVVLSQVYGHDGGRSGRWGWLVLCFPSPQLLLCPHVLNHFVHVLVAAQAP